jgi:hypothetical protein
MSVSNLAVVFGPTLMTTSSSDMAVLLRDSQPLNRLMGFIIANHAEILADEPPKEEPAPMAAYARVIHT